MKKTNYLKLYFLVTISFIYFFNVTLINAQTVIHRDSSNNFLTDYTGGLNVAEVPPAIDFGVVDIGDANPDHDFYQWGNVVLGPDDKYYYAIGDGSILILKSYDPKIKTDTICIYSPDVEPPLSDHAWHGRPTIDPSTGDMYLIGHYNGQVVKYNIYSKEIINYGQVVPGMGWDEHVWDYERNRLYGVNGNILVYDTENDTVIFSGKPFADFSVDSRARMVDTETGMFYGTGNKGSFYKYNPDSNVFTRLNSSMPHAMRASTNSKEADGSFWIFDKLGNIYRFFPDKDSLVSKGVNDEIYGDYMAFIERSSDGDYLYYISAGSNGYLIQYNTITEKKKVVANLTNYYSTNYSYDIIKCFGGALSRDGSSILLVLFGDDANSGRRRVALFHVQIPESERTITRSEDTYHTATTCDPEFVGIDSVSLFNQYGGDSLVITETILLPSDTVNLTTTTCNPMEVGYDTLFLTNQYSCDSLVITETILLPSDSVNLTESILLGESFQIGDSVFTETGHYAVILANQYGCDSLITLHLTVEKPASIVSIKEKNKFIKAYPNPTDGYINLSINNNIDYLRVNILSTTGQVIFNREYLPTQRIIAEQIDLRNYANGIYLIQITLEEYSIIKKFILKR